MTVTSQFCACMCVRVCALDVCVCLKPPTQLLLLNPTSTQPPPPSPQVAIALGAEVIYFELDNLGQLLETEKKEVGGVWVYVWVGGVGGCVMGWVYVGWGGCVMGWGRGVQWY